MSNTEKLQARFDHLIAFIEQATTETAEGKTSDLSDLDKQVTDICAEVQEAKPDIAKDLQPSMAQLISKLDTLEQALRASQEKKKKS